MDPGVRCHGMKVNCTGKDGEIYSDDTDKANLLNEYFTSQAFLDENKGSLPETITNPAYKLDSLTFTSYKVEQTLKSLPLGKAAGPVLINNRLLKELAQPLSIPLCDLFNFSLRNRKVPIIWKQANLSPTHKKNDQSEVSNYRPISLLSTVGKALEKLAHKQGYYNTSLPFLRPS